MLRSMTGYARRSQTSGAGLLTWEMKTVNHRYLELGFRLPEHLRYLEPELRIIATQYLQRGKTDAVFKIQASPDVIPTMPINKPLAHALIQAEHELRTLLTEPTAPLNLVELLRWPGVIQTEPPLSAALEHAIKDLFQETCGSLHQNRQTEGRAITLMMEQRLDQARISVDHIKHQIQAIQRRYEAKLKQRCHELKLSIEPQRLEQELLFYMHRADIAEELDRLQVHLHEFRRQLSSTVAVGRRLDFLLQEMNREINTLGSKSDDSDLAHHVVELKVIVEQLREQVQNVE